MSNIKYMTYEDFWDIHLSKIALDDGRYLEVAQARGVDIDALGEALDNFEHGERQRDVQAKVMSFEDFWTLMLVYMARHNLDDVKRTATNLGFDLYEMGIAMEMVRLNLELDYPKGEDND